MLSFWDISLSCGVAWGGVSDAAPRTALHKLPAGEENFDRALVTMREAVSMLVRFEKLEYVLVEAAMRVVDREHSAYSAFLLISLSAVAREAATRAGAHVEPVPVGKWRRAVLGNGNMPGREAKKAAMAFCDRLGWKYADHNVAEATCGWVFGMGSHYPKWRPGRIA